MRILNNINFNKTKTMNKNHEIKQLGVQLNGALRHLLYICVNALGPNALNGILND